jgi:hypothetical protein
MQPFRIEPQAGPEAYKTYAIKAPRSTHTRAATCAEVQCANNLCGFKVVADTSTNLGAAQAKYIANGDRKYTCTTLGTVVTFIFRAGTKCFAEHRVTLEREPLFIVKGGDYRGNPRGIPATSRKADEWVDDFANHQIRLDETIKRG